MLIVGLLFVFALVQVEDVVAEAQPATDETVGSTDPIAFKFSDEAAAVAPSDDETTSGSFWSEPAPVVVDDSAPLNESSFAEAEDETTATDTVEEDDDDSVVFAADADGANSTLVDDDGFDMVEDTDGDSPAE